MDQVDALMREWAVYPPAAEYVRQKLGVTTSTDLDLSVASDDEQDDADIAEEFDDLERMLSLGTLVP